MRSDWLREPFRVVGEEIPDTVAGTVLITAAFLCGICARSGRGQRRTCSTRSSGTNREATATAAWGVHHNIARGGSSSAKPGARRASSIPVLRGFAPRALGRDRCTGGKLVTDWRIGRRRPRAERALVYDLNTLAQLARRIRNLEYSDLMHQCRGLVRASVTRSNTSSCARICGMRRRCGGGSRRRSSSSAVFCSLLHRRLDLARGSATRGSGTTARCRPKLVLLVAFRAARLWRPPEQ